MIERPGSVLIITAHPDDLDFGAGGTIPKLRELGTKISYCICTDGHQGGEDPSVSRTEMRKIRRAEQIAAGKVLGVTDITFLGLDDGHLFPTLELRKAIVAQIRRVKPEVIITQSPERNWERVFSSHPDHMAVGEATMQAIYPDARNLFAFPDLLDAGLEPWTVSEAWIMAHPTPNTFVDITDTINLKIDALRAHVSQTTQMPDLAERITSWGSMAAERGGLAAGRYAEAFYVANTQ
ncbi:MAG: PIG-L deacetylase family protein [Candidatus Nanopelagicales bacterium]